VNAVPARSVPILAGVENPAPAAATADQSSRGFPALGWNDHATTASPDALNPAATRRFDK
jgi:hypothetical protein